MKKSIFYVIAVTALTLSMLSCSTKQNAISKLEQFSYELRDNGRYYTFRDWDRAAEEFTSIRKKLNKHNYTGEERRYIGELEGQCAGYVVEGLKGRVQDYGSELNGILEGLLDILNVRF